MVLLNLSHSKQKLLVLSASIIVLFESASADSLSLYNPLNIPKKSTNLYSNTQTLLANDAYSLKGLFNDFNGDFYNRDSDYFAVGDIRHDTGIYLKDIGYIGYTYRQEAVIKASSDAILLIHQTNHDLNLTRGKNYGLNLDIEGFETHGITFSRTLPTYRNNGLEVSLGVAGELLYGTKTQHGNINGQGQVLSEKDYDLTLQSNYFYTENHLYDLDVNSPTAYGYTTHIALLAKYDKYSLSIIVNDIYGKLYWKNLPFSDVNLASGNKNYNDEGYVEYSPIVSGLELSKDFTQTLMPKWRMESGYQFSEISLLNIGTEHIFGIYLPYLKYTHFYDDTIVSMSYENYFGMFGVDVNYKSYYIGIHSNGLIEPSAASINLGFNYLF